MTYYIEILLENWKKTDMHGFVFISLPLNTLCRLRLPSSFPCVSKKKDLIIDNKKKHKKCRHQQVIKREKRIQLLIFLSVLFSFYTQRFSQFMCVIYSNYHISQL